MELREEKEEWSTSSSVVGFQEYKEQKGIGEDATTKCYVAVMQKSNVIESGARNNINSRNELYELQVKLRNQEITPY